MHEATNSSNETNSMSDTKIIFIHILLSLRFLGFFEVLFYYKHFEKIVKIVKNFDLCMLI